MAKSPTRTVHIKKELREIIYSSLDFLERDYGDAVNYVLKKGIEVLGLPKADLEPFKKKYEEPAKTRKSA